MKELYLIYCDKCKKHFGSESPVVSGIATSDKPTICPYCGYNKGIVEKINVI